MRQASMAQGPVASSDLSRLMDQSSGMLSFLANLSSEDRTTQYTQGPVGDGESMLQQEQQQQQQHGGMNLHVLSGLMSDMPTQTAQASSNYTPGMMEQLQVQGFSPATAAAEASMLPMSQQQIRDLSSLMGMQQAQQQQQEVGLQGYVNKSSNPGMNSGSNDPFINQAQGWAANTFLAQQARCLFGGGGNAHTTLDSCTMPTATPGSGNIVTGRQPVVIYMANDEGSLSEYQCLVRQQIEVFEAGPEDVETSAQGRNRRIIMGQVGIRCRRCAMLPLRERRRGAVYYPTKLDGIYQAAQNIAKSHLAERCDHVSAATREDFAKYKDKKSSVGSGKRYWANRIATLGVYEDVGFLRFRSLSALHSL
jgi:hypothetical protein